MSGRPRQSSFELLRLLAMLAVVAGHVFTEARVTAHAPPETWLACLLLGSGARTAVGLFALLGCWFLADRPRFRADRWLRLHATVLCWTVPLTALSAAVWGGVSAPTAVRAFFPVLGRPLWFASAWLTLLLLAPALHGALAAAPRRAPGLAAAGLFAVLCVPATAGRLCGDYFSDLLWFVFLYFFAAWLKRSPLRPLERVPRFAALALALACYAAPVLVQWRVLAAAGPSPDPPAAYRAAAWLLADFKSAPSFLCALGLFVFFAKTDIGSVRWIDAAARPAFAVYVAHQTPAFWPRLWFDVARCESWRCSPWAPLVALGVAVAVYAAFGLLETARLRLLRALAPRFGGGRAAPAPDADDPVARIAARCEARGVRVGVAESCTGGLVAAALAARPGASAWLRGGVVSYATDLKSGLLGVDGALLAASGPVCGAVAEAMAAGARRALGADLAVSVTGLAGPDGDPARPDLPVGTVFLGWADAAGAGHEKRVFAGGRDGVRRAARDAALELLLRRLGPSGA